MKAKRSVANTVIFWFRRDLRLHDNAALHHALASGANVQPVFIFDREILDKLEDQHDARVCFIHRTITLIHDQLREHGASLAVYHDTALDAWQKIIDTFRPEGVYYNHDYEPSAIRRDAAVHDLLRENNIRIYTHKDQVVFEKSEIAKNDGSPYTVYTPYRSKWLEVLGGGLLRQYPIKLISSLFHPHSATVPPLKALGFKENSQSFPAQEYESIIGNYADTRDIPALVTGTTRLGVHLRFGTISIRELVNKAIRAAAHTWLDELIWREFFMMILWHFPHTVDRAFKPAYDRMMWRNHEGEFAAWCAGKTGYPLVDAGMRQLNETGFMHNRVRMIAASFLCKHLLIDWRWGEAYFARKLLDYEQSSNVGNWQWVAGCGTDAAPYFRIFNPALQTKKFDPDHHYIRQWVPEYGNDKNYPKPIVEHQTARERTLEAYKRALNAK